MHYYRGPDGVGAWSNSNFALGSVRLAIVGDCKLGLQPLRDRWGGHLVFNGEVFESKEILHSLGETLHPEDSDGVALEAVLAIKGPSGLSLMRGMFAGARYNPADGSVTLVRDTSGQKPLYGRVGEADRPSPPLSVPSASRWALSRSGRMLRSNISSTRAWAVSTALRRH